MLNPHDFVTRQSEREVSWKTLGALAIGAQALDLLQILHIYVVLTRRESRTSRLISSDHETFLRGVVIAPDEVQTMVDSRKDSAMADRIDDLTKRVETVETKLDRLSTSVDRRFDRVDAALIEQRQYTEFAYSRLEAKMDAGFGRVGRVERKLDQFIDVQLQTNQLVDRRLRALEEQRQGPDS